MVTNSEECCIVCAIETPENIVQQFSTQNSRWCVCEGPCERVIFPANTEIVMLFVHCHKRNARNARLDIVLLDEICGNSEEHTREINLCRQPSKKIFCCQLPVFMLIGWHATNNHVLC